MKKEWGDWESFLYYVYMHTLIETLTNPPRSVTHTSGDLDLFFPLKNSGKALLSMAWTLYRKRST